LNSTTPLKRVNEQKLKKRMLELLDRFSDKFSEAGITETDVEEQIALARKQ